MFSTEAASRTVVISTLYFWLFINVTSDTFRKASFDAILIRIIRVLVMTNLKPHYAQLVGVTETTIASKVKDVICDYRKEVLD